MIRVEGLSKVYGDFLAVRGSTFAVDPGEIFGIVGPNGAGKTTTLKMLAGLVEPTAGTAEIAGAPADDPGTRTALGFLPEESPLYEDMTPRSYLRFFADLYDVPRETARERIESTLDDLELEHRERRLGDMSKGMKRKVAIARSLVNDPDVLVYDEPASGLDPLTTNYVLEYVRELADAGKTVLFSAHNLYHVESVCDRVVIMNEGAIVARGTVEEIRAAHGETSYRVYTTVPVGESDPDGDRHVATVGSMDAVEAVRAEAEQAGGAVADIRTRESTLEEIFLDVAGQPMPGTRRVEAGSRGAADRSFGRAAGDGRGATDERTDGRSVAGDQTDERGTADSGTGAEG